MEGRHSWLPCLYPHHSDAHSAKRQSLQDRHWSLAYPVLVGDLLHVGRSNCFARLRDVLAVVVHRSQPDAPLHDLFGLELLNLTRGG